MTKSAMVTWLRYAARSGRQLKISNITASCCQEQHDVEEVCPISSLWCQRRRKLVEVASGSALDDVVLESTKSVAAVKVACREWVRCLYIL